MSKKIKDLGILAQFDNSSIHQILITETQKQHILSYLIQTSKNNSLQILQNPITSIEWNSAVDLSKDTYTDGNGY
jgi:hypothetical protein